MKLRLAVVTDKTKKRGVHLQEQAALVEEELEVGVKPHMVLVLIVLVR
jgi:hypothetical protein